MLGHVGSISTHEEFLGAEVGSNEGRGLVGHSALGNVLRPGLKVSGLNLI
jgi:hypothetical protein